MTRVWMVAAAVAVMFAGSAYAQSTATGVIGKPAPTSGLQVCGRDPNGLLTCLLFGSNGSITVADAANASFAKRTVIVAATDYTASAFRALEVTCSAPATLSATLLGETSSSAIGLAGGATYQIAYQIKSIDALPSGCVLKGLN